MSPPTIFCNYSTKLTITKKALIMEYKKLISIFDFSQDIDQVFIERVKKYYNFSIDCVEGSINLNEYLERSNSDLILLNINQFNDGVENFVLQFNSLTDRPPLLCMLCMKNSAELERLIELGIDDFVLKPAKESELLMRIRKIVDTSSYAITMAETKQYLKEKYAFSKLIGEDPVFLESIQRTVATARIDAPVLLLGETGTGKELFARAIHYLSPRSNQPYIAVNCGAIPLELFENELFGHTKGAYTDAKKAQKGYIAEAEGGTLFLDEINSMPIPAQVKLLRFLQEHEYKPLGAAKPIKANVRIIAASNIDLLDPNIEVSFRKDLLYRLDVFSITVPPLRYRRTDIPLLTEHFIKKYSKKYNIREKKFSRSAIQKLMSYDWPGNIRELENVIQKTIVLSAQFYIDTKSIKLPKNAFCYDNNNKSFQEMKGHLIEEFERNYITNMLAECYGNINRASQLARMDRKNFYRLMKKYNITRETIEQLPG